MPAKWYVVHVHSGFEKKVMQAILEKAEKMNIAAQFEEIMVPTEGVTEIRRGQKINTERKFFPGYVLVKMDLTDESWHLVRNIAKVTNFLGGGSRPHPISDAEAARLIDQMKEGADKPRRPSVTYEIGESVRVADGPFTSFNGTVEEVDEERSRLKVCGIDLWALDPGRAGILAGRESQLTL